MSEPPRLITVGVIAAKLNEPIHRVVRILATRQHIRPVAYAGAVRLFDSQAIEDVRRELKAIRTRRGSETPVCIPFAESGVHA